MFGHNIRKLFFCLGLYSNNIFFSSRNVPFYWHNIIKG